MLVDSRARAIVIVWWVELWREEGDVRRCEKPEEELGEKGVGLTGGRLAKRRLDTAGCLVFVGKVVGSDVVTSVS